MADPIYLVKRTLTGGFAGYGSQSIVQSRQQAVPAGQAPPAGATLQPGVTAQTDWQLHGDTVIPKTLIDHYGGFPGS